MLRNSWRLYTTIQSNQERATGLSDGDYCVLKYVFYNVQDWLRNEHLRVLEKTDIINDFN